MTAETDQPTPYDPDDADEAEFLGIPAPVAVETADAQPCYVIDGSSVVVHRGGCGECPPMDPLTGKAWATFAKVVAERDEYRERFHAASDAAAEVLLPALRPNGYITRPELWALDEACRPLRTTFPSYGPYLVGSVIERPTFRDVDVRLILTDEQYDRLADDEWGLLGFVTSRHLAAVTGLPIDFQFQRHTEASAAYGHKMRTPLGLREHHWHGDQRPEPVVIPPGVTHG